MIGEICVDACLAVKIVVEEEESDSAQLLFDNWIETQKTLVAPPFFEVEVASILRQKAILRGLLTADQANTAFEKFTQSSNSDL